MNTLSWIIMGLLVVIVILLVINNKFNFIGKYKDLRNDQKIYNNVHKKYKDLLNK